LEPFGSRGYYLEGLSDYDSAILGKLDLNIIATPYFFLMVQFPCRNCRYEMNFDYLFANTECPRCHDKPLVRLGSDGKWEMASSRDYIPPNIAAEKGMNPTDIGYCNEGMLSSGGAGGLGGQTHVNRCTRCQTVLVASANYCHNCGYQLHPEFHNLS
jgi:predicted Zn-ribbon and HTH transcriptional regulator